MAKREREHWAYAELRKRLEEKTESWVPHLQDASDVQILRITKVPDHELGTIFLMDPRAREAIDVVLLEQIYPHILETMEGESLVVPTIKKIKPQIETGRDSEPTRVVGFLMTDPARPVLTNKRPLWHFSFDLKARVGWYMLSCSCSISIPFAAAGSWLLDALTDPRIQEGTPELSVDRSAFVLNVSCDRGRSFLGEEWKELVAAAFKGHIGIGRAIDRFENEPFSYIVRNEMIQAVAETYQTLLRAD